MQQKHFRDISIAAMAVLFLAVSSIGGTVSANSHDVCYPKDGDTVHLKGRFSFYPIIDNGKGKDLVAGAYWTVRIFWTKNRKVEGYCSIRTENDGSWSKQFKRPTGADSLEIAVFSENEYVLVTSHPDGAHEVAKKPNIPIPHNQQIVDTGLLIADLSRNGPSSNKHLIGVGDVMSAAARFWDQTWTYGLDVKSKDQNGNTRAIKIYYPNTWYDCANRSGNTRTCASSDKHAKIWIFGPDITDKTLKRFGRHITVMHELAHQLNADRWDYHLPAYRLPTALAESCVKETTALIEGFATAIAAWAYYDETETKPYVVWLSDDRKPIQTNLETPDPQENCTKGEMDATWVSALFWDLLDDQVDTPSSTNPGRDRWYYQHPLTPFKIYLDPPKIGDILSVWGSVNGTLRDEFKRGLREMDKRRIDEIFVNNRMSSP